MPIRVQVGNRTVEFPDGTPEQEMRAAMDTLPPEDQPTTQKHERSWGETISHALPTVGGMAGSFLGGSKVSPVGMALAGVGGAGGEAFRQVADSLRGDFSSVPETIGGRLQKIGTEGLKQAGMEGAGRVVGAAVQPIAKTLYGLALRPSKALMRDAGGGKLVTGLKRIVDQGYGDAIVPSAMGTSRAGQMVEESAKEATRIARQSPHTVQTSRVIQRATDDQAKHSAKELITAGVKPKTDAIAAQIGNLIDSNPEKLSMEQLLGIRRGSEDVAAPVFKAAKLPGGAGRVAPGSEASVARSISGASKQTLDDLLGQGFRDVNKRTQGRMAVKQAVDDAASRPNVLTNLVAGGVGLAGSQGDMGDAAKKGILLRLLLSPTMQGSAALAAGRLPYAQLFRAADLASQK